MAGLGVCPVFQIALGRQPWAFFEMRITRCLGVMIPLRESSQVFRDWTVYAKETD